MVYVNTIDASYFFGAVLIAQKSDAAVSASLSIAIDTHEPVLLQALLGYELYKAYLAWDGSAAGRFKDLRDGLEYTSQDGTTKKWKGLRYVTGVSTKKSLIANYVYYNYMRENVTITSGTGEKQAINQNAINADVEQKRVNAWNEMVCENLSLIDFLVSKADVYIEFTDYKVFFPCDLIEYKNSLGL